MLRLICVAFLVSVCVGQLEVETTYGRVRGVPQGQGRMFSGIPYAAPPIGDLRFKAPREHQGWKDTLDLRSQPETRCIQGAYPPWHVLELGVMTEDCLRLIVTTPVGDTAQDKRLRPVMVWIHGGAFVMGSNNFDHYRTGNLSAFGDVVGVGINYRLSALGFLAHPGLAGTEGEGSFGFLDQQAALRWIRNNIRAFGGDPDRVTIFGESAGGMSVMMHMQSRTSKNLFQRAIIQSTGFVGSLMGLAEARATRAKHMERLAGCENDDVQKAMDCLRKQPAESFAFLVGLPPLTAPNGLAWNHFWPVYDEKLFYSPDVIEGFRGGNFNRVPLIIGHTAVEQNFMMFSFLDLTPERYATIVRYNLGKNDATDKLLQHFSASHFGTTTLAYSAFTSAATFSCDAHAIARALADHGAEVYAYNFGFLSPGHPVPFGATHTAEIPYAMHTVNDYGMFLIPLVRHEYDNIVEERVSRYWTDFAHGRFLGATLQRNGQLAWPPYTSQDAETMMMGGIGNPGFSVSYGNHDYDCQLLDQIPNWRSKTAILREPPTCGEGASEHCFAEEIKLASFGDGM